MALLAAVVIARSAVFVFWPGSHFDSDQAVTGLMAKHLSELRAFPVFWYGQTYMLGVEAWLAAPIMSVAGATVTALKLPLLAINIAIAWLLFEGMCGSRAAPALQAAALPPAQAAFATLFFVLPAPITTAHFLTANGGNVEPLLYILLLWFLRARPLPLGVVLGVGFLNREFTIYGAVALLILDASDRSLFRGRRLLHYATAFGAAAAVWAAIILLRHWSSAAGPGTSMADLSTQLAANNLMQVAERLCLDGRAMAAGVGRVFTTHWPQLFGVQHQPLTDFGIESTRWQGIDGAPWLLLPVIGIPLAHVAFFSRTTAPGARFAPYLVTTAALSIAGYLVGRCGAVDFYTMRYELISVTGMCGLAAWYLQRDAPLAFRAVWVASCAALLALSLTAHARLLAEYATQPPVPAKQELISALEARGIRYAYADYWTSYYVTFMTRERILVASTEIVKVRTHNNEVNAHRGEAIRISRQRCDGGEQLTAAFWACRP
jgi:hypothetical protein